MIFTTSMNSIIKTMLAKYNHQNKEERGDGAKETIQETASADLSLGDFLHF